jgi:hypothetical protein
MNRKRIFGQIYKLLIRVNHFWGACISIHAENEKHPLMDMIARVGIVWKY